MTFLCLKVSTFHIFLPNNKKINMVTPPYCLFFKKGMPHTTKYWISRKTAKISTF